MAQYDFSTLSSSDLEDLVCDLLNAEIPKDSPVKYKTFKDGKDKGIDFLYSTEQNLYEQVGQVKHYYRTGFAGMLTKLKNEDVAKVHQLTPDKYLFATSVDLSVAETGKVKDAFEPYIRDLNDIYGKKDLNSLIEAHDNVLTNHFKLWFSDTSVLTKILNSDLQFRSADFVENELKKRLRLYVKTSLFDVIRRNLAENNFVMITGEPGVGKTTLAEMLIYEYLKDDYELLFILDDIKEVERVLKNDNSKQIFYFDDFLGSNSAEINKAQGSERLLIALIRRIKRMTNKKFIFTTRSIVLNAVIQESEKFKRFSQGAGETVFLLNEYSNCHKEQLLINHIDESDIQDNLKNIILRKDIFDFIIFHQNFNPRSIEFITLNEIIEGFDDYQFERFIIDSLNNPDEIWKHAYNNQIEDTDRWLLNTLLTFDEKVNIDVLESAFLKRLQNCTTPQTVMAINPFRKSLERLNKGFIIIKEKSVDFINPSLKDFLINYLQTDERELLLILSSVKYVKQFSELFLSMAAVKNVEIPDDLKNDLMENYQSYLRPNFKDEDLINVATIVSENIEDSNIRSNFLVDIIYDIRDWDSLYSNYEQNLAFQKFVKATENNYKVGDALKERTEEIVNDLFTGENDLKRAVELLEALTETFKIDYYNFNSKKIIEHLDELFSEFIFEEAENLKDWITDTSEAEEVIDEVKALSERVSRLGISYTINMGELDCDWEEIARTNDFNRMMEKDD